MRESFNSAIAIMAGHAGEPSGADMQRAHDALSQAAAAPPAMAMLAVLESMGGRGEPDNGPHINPGNGKACDWFLRAAKSGFSPAVRGLGIVLLGNKDTQSMGAGLLRRAAQAGDWIANFLILRDAGRGHFYVGKADLMHMSSRLAPSVPFQASIIESIAALPDDIVPVNPAPFREQVCRNALVEAMDMTRDCERRLLHDRPRIEALPGALTPLECDYLIALSAPLMQPSKVVDADEAGAVAAGYRTSEGAVLLPAHMDFPAVCILRKLSSLAGVMPEQGEFLSLLRYRPGQEYRPHHDYLLPDAADYSRIKTCGQRRLTLLTYLNGGYEGGDTMFPDLDIAFKGAPGDALLFHNTDVSGAPLPASLHAGAPVLSGEKWLATLWCRQKPFWPWMREDL